MRLDVHWYVTGVDSPIEIRDRSIVLPCVQHGKIKKITKAEVAPDSESIVHVDLPERH